MRPAGLLYAANVLSIFVSIAVGLNLAVARSNRLGFSDIVVFTAVVLAMSKSTFIITALLYVIALVLNVQGKRSLCFKSLMLLAVLLALYYFCFPGLFLVHTSRASFWASIWYRFMDVAISLGSESLESLYYNREHSYGSLFNPDLTYSGISKVLKSAVLVPVLFFVVVLLVQYAYRLRQMRTLPIMPYVITLIVCFLTQFGTAYFAAPSFQFIAGLALFPLFKRQWQSSPHQTVCKAEMTHAIDLHR